MVHTSSQRTPLPRRRRGILGIAMAAALLAASGAAFAGARADANARYQAGNAAFDRSDFPTAVREYDAAYRETGDPDILFNLGQAARFSSQFDRAKKAYADYLTLQPNTKDKDAIREEIAQLDGLAKHAAKVKVTPPIGRSGPPTIEMVADPTLGGGASAIPMPPLGNKRVLLLVTEMNGPAIVFAWADGVWSVYGGERHTTVVRAANELDVLQTTLSDKLTEANLNVVDPDVLKGRMAAPARFEPLMGNDDARSVALHSMADLVMVVKGEAHVLPNPPQALAGSGMNSAQANVTARLIRVADGVVVAAATEHAAQVHIDPNTARQNALDAAAKQVAAKITMKTNSI